MRLRILYRYVSREVAVPFLLGLFVFTFVLLMFQILKITEMVVGYGVPLTDVAKVLAYILPPFLVFTIPMAFLLAVILAVGRLSSDSELIAIKAAGVSLARLYPPILAISLIAFGLSAFLSLHADPWGKQRFKMMLFEVGRRNATLGLKEQVFNDQFQDLVVYVNDVNEKTQELSGIFISDERNPKVPNVIVAERGQLFSSERDAKLVIRLEGGSIHRTLEESGAYEHASFDRYDVVLDFASLLSDDVFEKTYLEMSLGELARHIDALRAQGEDDYAMRRAWVEYHRKFAFPFACVVFGLIALPLGVVPPRSGRGQGFTLAIFALCLYYLLFRVGENLGWRGVIHPLVAMWAPNILFTLAGAAMLRQKSLERPVWIQEALALVFHRAGELAAKLAHGDAEDKE
ncbi:MAG: LPS export ABC transporter permease LptF [Deltaproteobacteria bacterium]|nr:LPS export ABC transporter permease LptF [Deltaproteobacteria bacterium]